MKINVLYQFNDAYAPYAGVSIVSLFENNRDIEDLYVYIIGDKISSENKCILQETAQDYHRSLIFLDAAPIIHRLKELNVPQYRGSHATNMKLFLPDILDSSVERILYIDADTAVIGSIRSLENFNMNGCPIAMAYDSLGRRHALQIGLQSKDAYFNAGIILIDLKQWKIDKCTQRIIDHVQKVRAHYMAPDQDLLNIVLKGQITVLPPEYNFQPVHYRYKTNLYQRMLAPQIYYSPEALTSASSAPVILHFFRFLGEFPWNQNSSHPYRDIFSQYLSLSKWKDKYKPKPTQSNWIFRLEKIFYRFLPDCIFLFIFKLGYEGFIKKCSSDSDKGENNRLM